jgi:putative tricarboxylic transport membrane protein
MRPGGLARRLASALPYAALLAGGAYLYADAGSFAQTTRPGELGPDFWPRTIIVALMIVCAVAMLRRLVVVREPGAAVPVADVAGGLPTGGTDDEGGAPAEGSATHPYRLLGGIVLSAAYVAGLEWLGFFVGTALYLSLFMVLGRYRRTGIIVATSLLGSLAFVFVFMKIVYVSLPLGSGPFRAVSIALLAALGIR